MASGVFGDQLDVAVRFAELLTSDGIMRGLLGPREAAIVWPRHILNCAVVGEVIPVAARVLDIGSGAGLPGIPLAIARPDVSVELVEPMGRRAEWLEHVTTVLGLSDRVHVTAARAADVVSAPAGVVVSRAVAPLGRLLPWCAPLTAIGGSVVALKGRTADTELDSIVESLPKWGLVDAHVARFGEGLLDEPTVAVVARRIQVRAVARAVSGTAPRATNRRTT